MISVGPQHSPCTRIPRHSSPNRFHAHDCQSWLVGSLRVNPFLLHTCCSRDLAQCLSHASHACVQQFLPFTAAGKGIHSLLHVHSTAARVRPCKSCCCRQT